MSSKHPLGAISAGLFESLTLAGLSGYGETWPIRRWSPGQGLGACSPAVAAAPTRVRSGSSSDLGQVPEPLSPMSAPSDGGSQGPSDGDAVGTAPDQEKREGLPVGTAGGRGEHERPGSAPGQPETQTAEGPRSPRSHDADGATEARRSWHLWMRRKLPRKGYRGRRGCLEKGG